MVRLGPFWAGFRPTLLAVMCAVTACGSAATTPSATPDLTVIAKVGTQSITQAQFTVRLQSVVTAADQAGAPTGGANQSAMLNQLRASVLRSLILDAVIAQEAQFRQVAASDSQINAEVSQDQQSAGGAAQLQQQLDAAGGSLEQLRDEARANLNEQHLEDYFAQQRAQGIVDQLNQGADFATLAKQLSDDTTSAASGGDIGVLTAAALDSGDVAFKNAVLALTPGAPPTKPLRDGDGYEILKLIAVTPQGRQVQRILVGAAQPYTVRSRPAWFSDSLFLALSQLCDQHKVTLYGANAGDPCSAAPSPTPRATP